MFHQYLIKDNILLNIIIKKLSILHKKVYHLTLKNLKKKITESVTCLYPFLEKLLIDTLKVPIKLYSIQ